MAGASPQQKGLYMFELTEDIKTKLIRNLKRNIRFSDINYKFDGNQLFVSGEVCAVIDYSDLPERFSFNKLYSGTEKYINDLRMMSKDLLEAIFLLPYDAFLRKVHLCKKDSHTDNLKTATIGDYYFIIICKYGDSTGWHEMIFPVNSDVMDRIGKSKIQLFNDVVKSYKAEGRDIIAELNN